MTADLIIDLIVSNYGPSLGRDPGLAPTWCSIRESCLLAFQPRLSRISDDGVFGIRNVLQSREDTELKCKNGM